MAKIYLDATGFQNFQTGVGRYSYNLINSILAINSKWNFVVLVLHTLNTTHPIYSLVQRYNNLCIKKIRTSTIGPKRDIRFIFPIGKYDLYHCLNSNLPFGIHGNSIVTIHDIIYFHYSQFLGSYPAFKRAYYNVIMRNIMRRATHIIAVSHATARDFTENYGKNENEKIHLRQKITVIHEGVTKIAQGSSNQQQPYKNRAKKYFMCIGEMRPHKNIDRLIAGFSLFRTSNPDASETYLYIAGSSHTSYTLPAPLPMNVEYIGKVSDAELVQLYRHTIALCFVSLYEGFGLPILEAMQQRAAVITSATSSMPEIAGDSALLVNPYEIEEIAKAMHSLYMSNQLRVKLITKGIDNVQKFSWDTCAIKTCELYRKLLAK